MATDPGSEKPKIRHNEYSDLDTKPGQKEPGGWLHSPAQLSAYIATLKALIIVAAMRGFTWNDVKFVRVSNVEGEKRVFIYPTDETDPSRLELTRYKSRLYVNMSAPLTKWKLALPTGERRRYDLPIDPKSPVGPALVIHLDKPLEVKFDKKKTPAQDAAPGSQSPPTDSGSQQA